MIGGKGKTEAGFVDDVIPDHKLTLGKETAEIICSSELTIKLVNNLENRYSGKHYNWMQDI